MVKIIDGWYYEYDGMQYILIHEFERERFEFRSKKKTGEIRCVKDIVGYFSTLSAMVVKLVALLAIEKISSGEITTIEQYIETLKKYKEEIENHILPF